LSFPAFLTPFNGSPKTENIKDAIAHAESGKPLERLAAQQMPAVRKQRAVAHRLPIVRVLPWPPGPDVGRQVSAAVALWAMPDVEYWHDASTSEAASIFILHSVTKVRKVSH
jgi:hypothetical protein